MINKFTLSVVTFLVLFSFSVYGQKATYNYIRKYKPIAESIWQLYGIPPAVTLGIAIEESGSGTSILCTKFHNHFGFKGRNHNSHKKLGYFSKYKEYNSAIECFNDFTRKVTGRKLYQSLKGNPDSKLWIAEFKKLPYASAPHWATHINKTIAYYKLDRLATGIPWHPKPLKPKYVPAFRKYQTCHCPIWY
jgi:flagellum-specific peptidoglycan hydrolase FlgJ